MTQTKRTPPTQGFNSLKDCDWVLHIYSTETAAAVETPYVYILASFPGLYHVDDINVH